MPLRRVDIEKSLMLVPSMVISPLLGSYNRRSNWMIVLLPEPDGPTIAVDVPALTLKETP